MRARVRRGGTGGRRAVVATAAVAGALVLVACADDGSTTTSTAFDLTATNFVTQSTTPSTTPTTPAPGGSGQPGQPADLAPDEYAIQSGDFPSTIANRYGVTLADLLLVNGWTLVGNQVPEFPTTAGTIIKLPPNAVAPGTETTLAPTESTTAPSSATTVPPVDPTTSTVASDGRCTYVILAEDTSRVRVANKFDVTVEQLDAANANTPGYGAFYAGLEIIIPSDQDC